MGRLSSFFSILLTIIIAHVKIPKGVILMKILFQGDSITDCRRDRSDDLIKGYGYASMVTGRLNFEQPGAFQFQNRGIGGNRVVDVYARVKSDIINLEPDVMSILIGVNDVWHEIGSRNGASAEKYEKIYDMLIEEVLTALPNIKIMIIEPFVVKGSETEKNWELFYSEVRKRAEAAKRIAVKYNLKFIPTQDEFDKAVSLCPEPFWTREGVHPTEAGHELLTRLWLDAFNEMMK